MALIGRVVSHAQTYSRGPQAEPPIPYDEAPSVALDEAPCMDIDGQASSSDSASLGDGDDEAYSQARAETLAGPHVDDDRSDLEVFSRCPPGAVK